MRPSLLLACAALVACKAGDGDEGASEAEDTGVATGDTEAMQDPAFLNPSIGEFSLPSSQHVPKDITVRAIVLGNTQLLLDGRSVGSMPTGDPLGELTEDRLRLDLRGAMTTGVHTLQLVTRAPGGLLYSNELTMRVEQPHTAMPPVTAELDADAIGEGDALVLGGAGRSALLGLVDHGPTPTLRPYLAEAGGWSSTPAGEILLEGHVPEPMSFAPAISALALPPADGEEGPAGVRVAWRRRTADDAIVTRDLALGPEPAADVPRVALELDAPLLAGAEHVELGRPVLAGDALLVEFTAAADAEIAHPGDRGLAQLRWRPLDARWGPAQRISAADPTDLDATGPVNVLEDTSSGEPQVSVRVGQRLPGLLTLSPTGAARLTIASDHLNLYDGEPCVLSTIAGSLGSRTAAIVTRDRGVSLSFFGEGGDLQSDSIAPDPNKMPDAPVTGPPGVGVLVGYTVFLIPYGSAAPVQLVFADGFRAYVQALESPEPLHCQAVALAPGLAGNAEAALPLACLHAGELRLGTLRAAVDG